MLVVAASVVATLLVATLVVPTLVVPTLVLLFGPVVTEVEGPVVVRPEGVVVTLVAPPPLPPLPPSSKTPTTSAEQPTVSATENASRPRSESMADIIARLHGGKPAAGEVIS